MLDYKVSDLRRQLDKLRSKNNSHSKYLDLLHSESSKMKEERDNDVRPNVNSELNDIFFNSGKEFYDDGRGAETEVPGK